MKPIIVDQPANNQWRNPHKIIHVPLLGGWFVVRGAHDTPISGRFPNRYLAQAWLDTRQRDA